MITDISGVRRGVWLWGGGREGGEKLRALISQHYLAGEALLYVELLADKNAFRAPIAWDLWHSPRYNLTLSPGPQSPAL